MRDQNHQLRYLDLGLYSQSQAKIRMLKSRLPEDSVESLAREVIRRLAEQDIDASVEAPSDDQLEHLCHALLSGDDHAGTQFIRDVRTEGASVEVVYLRYLAQAARMLGEWWEEDLVSFGEVTLGTSRMYAIMRALRRESLNEHTSPNRSAVFASVPGETHTLGVRMAADLFRKDGWDIELMVGMSHEELVSEIRRSKA